MFHSKGTYKCTMAFTNIYLGLVSTTYFLWAVYYFFVSWGVMAQLQYLSSYGVLFPPAGNYNKQMHKMIYLENRRFLPATSSLRQDKKNFPTKAVERRPPPMTKVYKQMKGFHSSYDNAKNRHHHVVLTFEIQKFSH